MLALLIVAQAAQHAVLLAGTKGFYNYRHQAEICMAYHTFIEKGVPSENIVVMMYDDVVESKENPYQGSLLPQPGQLRDVNGGCIKDYVGQHVNPQVFVQIITGQSQQLRGKGSGRVLRSGQEDHVTLYIASEGGSGAIAFPDALMFADELIEALSLMKENRKFGKLLVVVDSSQAGSLFEKTLQRGLEVAVMTSTDYQQQSYATFCPPLDNVNEIHIGTCLSDAFSNLFLQKIRVSDQLTIEQFFRDIDSENDVNNGSLFGSSSMLNTRISDFFGNSNQQYPPPLPQKISIPVSDVKLKYFLENYKKQNTGQESNQLVKEISHREIIRGIFNDFAYNLDPYPSHILNTKIIPQNFQCLRSSAIGFEQFCGQLSEYGLSFLQILVNACESGYTSSQIVNILAEVCSYNHFDINYSGFDDYEPPLPPIDPENHPRPGGEDPPRPGEDPRPGQDSDHPNHPGGQMRRFFQLLNEIEQTYPFLRGNTQQIKDALRSIGNDSINTGAYIIIVEQQLIEIIEQLKQQGNEEFVEKLEQFLDAFQP